MQAAQFQSESKNEYGTTGWSWGSKCTAAGECDSSASPNDSSVLTEMPRSYIGGKEIYGGYYPWYSATAETGKYTSVENASDSLCPTGWQLPGNSKKLSTLFTQEDLIDSSSVPNFRKATLSFVWAGLYAGGRVSYDEQYDNNLSNRFTYIWSSATSSNLNKAFNAWIGPSGFGTGGADFKTRGFSVRCVQK